MTKISNEALGRLTVEAFKATKKNHFIVLLDDVRSLHNVGSAFRTCDAFLAEKLFLCGITGTPPDREIHKTALGATESVDWVYEKDIINAVHHLKKEGYKIISIEQADNSVMLQNFKFNVNEKYVFIFGNEVNGVNEKAVELSDDVIEIPQFGTKHSINISVSLGIVVWEYFRSL